MPRRPVRAHSAALVFALLVVATVAGFAWAQRLKRDPLVLDRVTVGVRGNSTFTPNGDCRHDRIRIRFRVTRSDHATVQVIRPGGHAVITLARDRFLKRYHFFTFYWDGRHRGGPGPASPGTYRLRVKLFGQERLLVPPARIHLLRAPARKPGVACARAARPAS